MFDEKHIEPELKNKDGKFSGYTTDSFGYVLVRKPSHPSNSSGYVKLHRLVMEVELGKYLTSEEHVHHKDENKKNNDPSNLELTDVSKHRTIHNNQSMNYESKYDLEEVKRLYQEGVTTRDISRKLGIGKSTVSYHLRKSGISRTELSGKVHINNPNNQRKISDSEIKEINRLKNEGKKIKEIIEIVGYSRDTIYRYLNK